MNETAARRAPSVAGVAGGVGTTTIARALAGSDRGVFTGRPVDVLVCRATADSLVRAARAAYLISSQQHRRPVLAVNTTDTAGPSRPSVARMRLLEPHTAGVVVLPYVRRWRDLATPLQDVTGLLAPPVTELPRPLRRFATAVHSLADRAPPQPDRRRDDRVTAGRQGCEVVRPDVDARDVILLIGYLTGLDEQEWDTRARHLLRVVLDGLRSRE